MKEQPIIFSASMVQAILEGLKTQTRRIIKPQPWLCDLFIVPKWIWRKKDNPFSSIDRLIGGLIKYCPYGSPGDKLWVRETWGGIFLNSQDGYYLQWRDVPKSDRTQERCEALFYRATDDDPDYEGCWVPSIFMPRWASRLTLEILNVRAERLQSITYENILAEGIFQVWPLPTTSQLHINDLPCKDSAHEFFIRLWDSLNKRRGFSYATNPWVWAIEFKVLEP